MRFKLLAVIAWTLALHAGCRVEEPLQRASVQGTVTWKKEPIEDGTIVFVPKPTTRGPAVGVPIVNGKYSVDKLNGPFVGTSKIEIMARRKTGKTIQAAYPAQGTIEETEQFLPAEFNAKSKLSREVYDEDNQFNFDLAPK